MSVSTKKLLFNGLLILLPIFLLGLLEFSLRLFDVFPQPPLVIETYKNGREYYQLNQWVAKRYFDENTVTVPGAIPDAFRKHKTKETFRIFCLGGSTTAGFPFDCQVPFPVQLRYLLSESFPEYEFEVINTGISAVNSFTVLDLMPEILEHRPDLILIYMGHNEFYGAYGSASAVSSFSNDSLVRLYLKLQKLHLVQMLKQIISSVSPSEKAAEKSLMASVVEDRSVLYGSTTYKRTLSGFTKNLDLILAKCSEQGVPVMIGNLAANLRDMPPFASATLSLAAEREKEYDRHFKQGKARIAEEDFESAIESLQQALDLDSTVAELHYHLAKAYDAAGDSTNALRHYVWAKDLDIIRFRASEDVNEIILNLSSAHGADFVDMRERFEARSPQGLIGANIMVDHLHPDPVGYFVMAKAFYQHILTSGLLAGRDSGFTPGAEPYHVTELDWEIGQMKIFEMTHRWPFPEKDLTLADYRSDREPVITEIAKNYLLVENVWSKAHYKLAEHYVNQKRYERAREEYLAVSVFVPDDPYPYRQIAETYQLENKWAKREHFLQKALAVADDKGMVSYQIALTQWKQSKFNEACQSMLAALDYPDLDAKEKQNARYYLAGFYADAGDIQSAQNVLIDLLRENPNFKPAQIFLQKLLKNPQQ